VHWALVCHIEIELLGEVRGSQQQAAYFCRGQDRRVHRSPLDALHLKLKALAEVATVPLPSHEQLSSLFRTLGFDEALFGASDQHRRVKRLQLGSNF
jgi:hypothetical protein